MPRLRPPYRLMSHEEQLEYHRVANRKSKAKKRASRPYVPNRMEKTEYTCTRCKGTFPNTAEFFHATGNGKNLNSRCKKCVNELSRTYIIRKDFGLTKEQYDAAFTDAVCEICSNGDRLVMDHCHERNLPRGILCANCNAMIGFACHEIEILEAAIRYLQK